MKWFRRWRGRRGWTVTVRFLDGSVKRFHFVSEAEALEFEAICSAVPGVAQTYVMKGREL